MQKADFLTTRLICFNEKYTAHVEIVLFPGHKNITDSSKLAKAGGVFVSGDFLIVYGFQGGQKASPQRRTGEYSQTYVKRSYKTSNHPQQRFPCHLNNRLNCVPNEKMKH